VLDGLKPGWLGIGNPPQTGALHEAFGDLTAIFLALSQLDQVEAFVAITKANLHAKNYLSALAEQFGAALGRSAGLRNADNDLKLSQVSNEVHELSQVFTGAIYDILADIYAHERIQQGKVKDPAQILLEVAHKLCRLLLEAIIKAPANGATFADVATAMLTISKAQGDPPAYRPFIHTRFAVREIVVPPVPLTASAIGQMDYGDPNLILGADEVKVQAADPNHPSLSAKVPQDRSGCCGTMQLPEYARAPDKLQAELQRLTGRRGHSRRGAPGWRCGRTEESIQVSRRRRRGPVPRRRTLAEGRHKETDVIVRVTQTGGFAGGSEPVATVDTSTLTPASAARIKDRIAALRRFVASGTQPIGADLYRYEIDIVDDTGKAQRLVVLHEGEPGVSLPEPLAGLLQEVQSS